MKKTVRIALVGKYVELKDAYISVSQALKAAGYALDADVKIEYIKSMNVTRANAAEMLSGYDGLIVPGGFGTRGSEGKKEAIRFARENGMPFLGICFGMQLAVIEYCEDVLGMKGANSTEFDPECDYPVIDYLRGQHDGIDMGGTLRLGGYECHLREGSLARKLYGKDDIVERHRHRYEVNPSYVERINEGGLAVSGTNPGSGLVEIVELPGHPFFIACQFHPEFTSRPMKPNPLFKGLVEAALAHQEGRK